AGAPPRRGQPLAFRAEREEARAAGPADRRDDLPARVRVPELDDRGREGGQPLAVRAESDPAVTRGHLEAELAALGVPDVGRRPGCRGHLATVRTEGDPVDALRMPPERADLLAGGRVPEPDLAGVVHERFGVGTGARQQVLAPRPERKGAGGVAMIQA